MSLLSVTDLLGGKEYIGRELQDKMDFFEVGNKGLTIKSVEHLAKNLSLSKQELAKILPVSLRTLQRHKTGYVFNQIISEHILKLAEVFSKGIEVFGNKEKFINWLNYPILAFSNKKPFELLESSYGIEMVLDELIRIEYGVFS